MPYYLYAVKPFGQLERLGEHAAFKDASAAAKRERAARTGRADATGLAEQVRVMFAPTAEQAEDLLLQRRDPPPPGDE
ncbi:MAG: hypothetical protein JNL30_07505 [Rubrivivax sp.]|nr:hypothetical protein [Rubrivivax sp.]